MKNDGRNLRGRTALLRRLIIAAAALLIGFATQSDLLAFTLNVVRCDQNNVCAPLAGGFRWIVEEDTANYVDPITDPQAARTNSLGVSIHKSHAPVVASGHGTGSSAVINVDAARRYVVSVLPDAGHDIGGANVAAGQASVTVTTSPHPIQAAQISVLVFHDYKAMNRVPDIPAEPGLPGFTIQIFDNLGQVSTDVFGNPLGTTYMQNADGTYQFDVNGNPIVQVLGAGAVVTDANGRAIIKNLSPNNYGVVAAPPAGQVWAQTTTLAGGTQLGTIVKAGEPPFFSQRGLLSTHVFIGFVQPFNLLPAGNSSITGRAVDLHSSRPPSAALNLGSPVPSCWVGLNTAEAGAAMGLLAQPCNADSTFTISGIPAGTYQLVVWDFYLQNVQSFRTVTTLPGQTVNVGDVVAQRWLGTLMGSVFNDVDQDGIRDLGETGIPQQNINLRFRDGSIYQALLTTAAGDYVLQQVGILGQWLVAEVDFARYKATGASIVVDNGGPLTPLPIHPYGTVNTPQPQPENANQGWRVETVPAPVLLEGVILHPDQVNVINWGKAAYASGENGGISGVLVYAMTRAEDDPRYAAADPWEPAVPNVQVNLYLDANGDMAIDDVNGDGVVTLADVDNYPLGWIDGVAPKGPEDVDRNGNGLFNAGDAVNAVHSDSFDAAMPTGCVGPAQTVHGAPIQDCAETLLSWNQVRSTVFDGGYMFLTYFPGGMGSGSLETTLPAGSYIVEAVAPPGYMIVKEEDKNVDFGNAYSPSKLLLPNPCVGDPHVVPAELSLFPGVPSFFAGQTRPLCDRRQLTLNSGQNAAADFHIFTEVPKSAQIVGKVVNPFANQANPNDPNFGGPFAPSWIPISIQDHNGREIVRVYTDEWGAWNARVPSTYSAHVPTPSGLSPGVLTVCANHPGPIIDRLPGSPTFGQVVVDPRFNPDFNQPCLNIDAWPGRTSYMNMALSALTAFVGATTVLDCEQPAGTPIISQVNGPLGGPHIAAAGATVTLQSAGMVAVPNPDYDPNTPGSLPTITRDYTFGSVPGTVTVGGLPLTNLVWSVDGMTIAGTAPAGVATGQVMVTRGDNGRASSIGVTLHVGGGPVIRVAQGDPGGIQGAINAAPAGSIILVGPGLYRENLILWKPLVLQGYGAFSTVIDASNFPVNKAAWTTLLGEIVNANQVVLVQNQRADFGLEDGAGIMVLADQAGFTNAPRARIDGFTVTRARMGGGVFVSGYAHFLEISNNRIISNHGTFGGGIRAGWTSILNADSSGYISAFNDNLLIHHNHIAGNGSTARGGGIGFYKGSDNYLVADNYICGNYAANGAGIAHYGLSGGGRITRNKIILNEARFEGAGLFMGGELVPAGANPALLPGGFLLTEGSGSFTVDSNLIQGNLAIDDAAAVSFLATSGQDVASGVPFALEFVNNMVVNNVSGFVAGGIGVTDAMNVVIANNTIAHNDCTGTTAALVGGQLVTTTPNGSGIVLFPSSAQLAAASGMAFPNPDIRNNIIWHNRSFYYDSSANGGLGALLPDPVGPYWDIRVFGAGASPNPVPLNNILSYTTDPHSGFVYDASNIAADPLFTGPYLNTLVAAPGANALVNFVKFSPLTPTGDYHIRTTSPAVDRVNAATAPSMDYDGEARPQGAASDIGADEVPGGASGLTINAAAGTGGTINPSGTVGVALGGSQTFTITPNTGYHITNVFVDGVAQGVLTSYTFTNITRSHNISARFASNTYTINSAAGTGGAISPLGKTTVNYGGSQTYTITPNAGYHMTNVFVDGVAQGVLTSYTFSNVTANHNISARFAINTYTINSAAGTGGAISPLGKTTVNYGGSQTYTITPNAGYHITNVFVDGVAQGVLTSYTFNNVTANHNISARFAIN